MLFGDPAAMRCGTLMGIGLAAFVLAGCASDAPETADAAVTEPPASALNDVVPAAGEADPDGIVGDEDPGTLSEPIPEEGLLDDGPPIPLSFAAPANAAERQMMAAALDDQAQAGGTLQAARFDLDNDGTEELIARLHGGAYCGNFDVCSIWILNVAQGEAQFLNDDDDAAACVAAMPSMTNGYHDVRLYAQCGQTAQCFYDLEWDGAHYVWRESSECVN